MKRGQTISWIDETGIRSNYKISSILSSSSVKIKTFGDNPKWINVDSGTILDPIEHKRSCIGCKCISDCDYQSKNKPK